MTGPNYRLSLTLGDTTLPRVSGISIQHNKEHMNSIQSELTRAFPQRLAEIQAQSRRAREWLSSVSDGILRVYVEGEDSYEYGGFEEYLEIDAEGLPFEVHTGGYGHRSEISSPVAWGLLATARARALKELEQAEHDLRTCAAIEERLKSRREY